VRKRIEVEQAYPSGHLVRYYHNGWRAGHIYKCTSFAAIILPIPAKGSVAVKKITIPLEDVKEI
jgi:hypothetical protein